MRGSGELNDDADCLRSKEVMVSRRWFGLHPLTWLGVLTVAGSIGYCQIHVTPWIFSLSGSMYATGWPVPCIEVLLKPHEHEAFLFGHEVQEWSVVSELRCLFNFASSALILCGVGLTLERWARNRFRMRITTLFGVTSASAVALWVGHPWLLPWWEPHVVQLGLAIGMAITFFAAGWLAFHLVAKWLRHAGAA